MRRALHSTKIHFIVVHDANYHVHALIIALLSVDVVLRRTWGRLDLDGVSGRDGRSEHMMNSNRLQGGAII